jgi:hypothetical protein
MQSFGEYLDEDMDEAIKRTVVIRKGQRKIKYKTDRAGYKVSGGREVKIGASDAIKMSIRNTKSARKRKGKTAQANMRRAKSMTKRTGM